MNQGEMITKVILGETLDPMTTDQYVQYINDRLELHYQKPANQWIIFGRRKRWLKE